jgi:hypothetical protein
MPGWAPPGHESRSRRHPLRVIFTAAEPSGGRRLPPRRCAHTAAQGAPGQPRARGRCRVEMRNGAGSLPDAPVAPESRLRWRSRGGPGVAARRPARAGLPVRCAAHPIGTTRSGGIARTTIRPRDETAPRLPVIVPEGLYSVSAGLPVLCRGHDGAEAIGRMAAACANPSRPCIQRLRRRTAGGTDYAHDCTISPWTETCARVP